MIFISLNENISKFLFLKEKTDENFTTDIQFKQK